MTARARADEREPLVAFVHIQKTAGLTLRKVLQRQYPGPGAVRLMPNHFAKESSRETVRDILAAPPRSLRAIHGHILFWDSVDWPADARLFTVLRDPVERVISHYYWLLGRKVEAGGTLRLSLAEAVERGEIRDNLGTRVLGGADPHGAVGRELLDRAVARLDRFAVVGLTERFDATLLLLERTFGWRPPFYERENVNTARPPRAEIGRDTIALIESHNALDRELYDKAEVRFRRDVAAQGPTFAIDVEAFRRANAAVVSGQRPRKLPRRPAEQLDLGELLTEARTEALLGEEELGVLTDHGRVLLGKLDTLTRSLEQARGKVETLEARGRPPTRLRPSEAAARALAPPPGTAAASVPPVRKPADAERRRLTVERKRLDDRLVTLQQRISDLEMRLRLADEPKLTAELERLKDREAATMERLMRVERRQVELT